MIRKQTAIPYWEMTAAQLREATKEFDEEFAADKSRPLTSAEQALWKKIRAKRSKRANGRPQKSIAVHLEEKLLDRCTALAKRKRISRDTLIARSLKAYLMTEEA